MNIPQVKIAISGKMGSGKTTACKYLNTKIPGLDNDKLARPLYDIAWNVFGMSRDESAKDRNLLIRIGNALRSIDNQVFPKALVTRLPGKRGVIVDDLRMKYELDILKKAGFLTLRLQIDPTLQEQRIRRTYPDMYQKHLDNQNTETEIDLDDYEDHFDYIINITDDGMEKFEEQLYEFYRMVVDKQFINRY